MMKQYPKKKYKPGELARTRSRLGDISEEEARKMLSVLGGEIGIEHEAEDLRLDARRIQQADERRKRLGQMDMAREDFRNRRSRMWAGDAASPDATHVKKPHERERLGYLDRIRINYLSTKPEHRLKNLPGVIASVFSFFPDSPDYISPFFIKNTDELFFFSLGSFVRAVRGLFTKAKPDAYREIAKNAFYANILATLKMWDIEGINMELAMLQRNSYRADLSSAAGLVRKLYRPFGILLLLDYEVQIQKAVRWAYEMNIAMTPPENRAAWKTMMKNFETATELLPVVFSDIKRMMYPLLLKLSCTRFLFFEEFFVYERKRIFRFLALGPENIINPQDERTGHAKGDGVKKSGIDDEESVDTMNEDIDEEKSETRKSDKKASTVATSRDFEKGVTLLDALFPGAGFTRLESYPDLYPYFEPLFEFPQGFELVPPSDPLQQLVVLTTIIGNMLYGFRHIRFGVLRSRNGSSMKDREEIEALLAQWPMFLEETVYKTYVVRLADLCRNIEKDVSFIKSELGRKATRELETIKRTHFLPHRKVESSFYTAIPSKKNYSRFFEVVKQTRDVLIGIVSELNTLRIDDGAIASELAATRKSECESVRNPGERYVFDLENPVSKRLDWIAMKSAKRASGAKKSCDTRTNSDIIRTCLTLVSTVDFLVNSESSHFYKSGYMGEQNGERATSSTVYRTTGTSAHMPEYSVGLLDTLSILRKSEKEQERECEPAPEPKEVRKEWSFVKAEQVTARLARDIEEYRIRPVPFALVFIRITGINEVDAEVSGKAEELVRKEMRPDKDLFMRLSNDEFLILSKRTDLTLAKTIGMKMIGRIIPLYELKTRGFTASCGVLRYRKDWDLNMLSNVIEKVKRIVRKQVAPRLVFLDDDNLTLKGIPV